MNLMYVIVLGAALSLDALLSGIAYGLKNIKLPWYSLVVVGAITFLCTALAMICANMIGRSVDTHLATVLGAVLMIILGLWSIFVEYMTVDTAVEGRLSQRKLKISVGRLVIKIMADPEKADLDLSNEIGPIEGVFLGLALGIDNMVATFAACLTGPMPVYTPIIMAITQVAFIFAGLHASSFLVSDRIKQRAPYLSGIVLLLLGLIRLQ